MVEHMVPFLYQTSPHPFNEEVDFFNFLAKLWYMVQDTKIKNEKRKATGSDGANNGDGGTNNDSAAGTVTKNNGAGTTGGAGSTCTNNNGAGGPQALTMVLNVKVLMVIEVQEPTWQ